ncbi:MAG: LacI family transcriptional regulator [candidate division GAL15 bacterium]
MPDVVTILDVARAAGVSPATVSRVLNGAGHPVREATRHRVLEAARRLEYYPNRLARGLLWRQTHVLGFVVPDVSNPYYAAILRGVEEAAAGHGLVVMLCNTGRDPGRVQACLRTLLEHRVDGIVVAGGTLTAADVRVVQGRVPLVAVGRHRAPVPSVRVDNADASRKACQHLLQLGHRQVACLAGPRSSLTARDRVEGYRAALREAGIWPRARWVVWSDLTAEGGYRAARQLLSTSRVTALVACNDQMALGALRALWEAGLRVPQDVSVVGFDDTPTAAVAVPALTTIAIPAEELGRRALELFLAARAGRSDNEVVLPTQLRVRESTASPPGLAQRRRWSQGRRRTTCRHP